MNGVEYLDRRETILHLYAILHYSSDLPLVVDSAVLHPTSKGKECLSLQTTYKTRLRIARTSV